MNKTLSALTLAVAAACLPTIACANLVVNGSFEDVSPSAGIQTQANGSWSIYNAIDGWVTTAGAGIEVRNNVAGTASNGSNYVELDSNNNSAMAQTILTTFGSVYALSFDYSPRIGVAAASNGIEVLWNNSLVTAAITASGMGLSNHAWVTYSFAVQGTGNDVLSFRAVGTNDALGGSLDNVQLVPEPGTMAAMLAGLAALGYSTRIRRQRFLS